MQLTIEQLKKCIISELEYILEKTVVINVDLNILIKETKEQFNYIFVYERDNKLFVEKDFNENAVAEIEYDTEADQIMIRDYIIKDYPENFFASNTNELPF